MRNADAAVLVDHLRQHFAEHVDRVGHCAAKVAGVQVALRACHFNFPVGQAAQPCGERGEVLAEHARVAHQDDVALEQLAVAGEEGVQAGRPDFFLALKNELHVVPQLARAHQVLKRLDLQETLSLVVVGAACPDAAVAHLGLKGGGLPQFERRHGHHVVVAVDEHRGCSVAHMFLGKHERVAVAGHHLGLVGPGLQQQFTPEVGAAQHVGVVRGFGTDARNAEQ